MYEFSFPQLSYNKIEKKFINTQEMDVYQIDKKTIDAFLLYFQKGVHDNFESIEQLANNEDDLLLLPPNWYNLQIQLLVKELNYDGMPQLHVRYNMNALWKLISAKWYCFMASVCMLEKGEISENIIQEYNKHIKYMDKEFLILLESAEEISALLQRNINSLKKWNNDKILNIMNGGHLQSVKVPGWASMFSEILTTHLDKIKNISVAKDEKNEFYYSLSGNDFGHEKSPQPKVVDDIRKIFSLEGVSTNPIRCYLMDNVLYSIDGVNDLTYKQYKNTQYHPKQNRLFSCTERKIMAKFSKEENVMIVSGWEPCYMCTRVNFKHYPNVKVIGLEEHNEFISQSRYDDIAMDIIVHP